MLLTRLLNACHHFPGFVYDGARLREDVGSRGKGSHQTLYYGTAFTIVRNPKDELKAGTLHALCGQLGIKSSDL